MVFLQQYTQLEIS